MTKGKLITRIAAQHEEYSQQKIEAAVNTLFDTMREALVDGKRIELRTFGSFMVREYKAYEGRNPRTGDKVDVQEKRSPFFKAGRVMLKRLNEGSED